MENLIKKLEEQVAFLQREISQISDELYLQQKEISTMKKEVLIFERRINELESGNETNLVTIDKKPPHY